MFTILRLALRNIGRNKRRTFFTLLILLSGLTAINLFQGYQTDTLSSLADGAVYGEALGHLVVLPRGGLERRLIAEADAVLSGEDLQRIEDALTEVPDVAFVAPRLLINGLITNGQVSLVFYGLGMEPALYQRLRERFSFRGQGSQLTPDEPNGGMVAEQLAAILDLSLIDDVTLFSTTLKGRINAIDMDVIGIYDTGSAATNDKYIVTPIDVARSLYRFDGAHEVAVVLAEGSDPARAASVIESAIREQGLDVEVRDWESMSAFFRGVRELYGMIFGFIALVVMVVALMSVLNTMTMVVLERVREIGILRALGMRPGAVQRLFVVEGILIGLIAAACAVVLTLVIGAGINAAEITYTPPGISAAVSLHVVLNVGEMVGNGVGLALLCGLISLLPARRAAHFEIVRALRHV